jgi:excisionase family DNA binding protein
MDFLGGRCCEKQKDVATCGQIDCSTKYKAMKLDLTTLPNAVKLEVSKEDLLAFADRLRPAHEKKELNSTPSEEALLSFEEMCEFLGIAKSTGYQRIGRGEIPHFKKGRRLYFRKSELLRYIESGRRKTRKELEEAAKEYLSRAK